MDRGGARGRIRDDLELMALLPDDSPHRATLLSRAEDQIEKVLVAETTKTRDPLGIALALVFLLSAVGVLLGLARDNGWWGILVAALVIFGLVGLNQDAVKRVRDERGRPIKDSSAPESKEPPTFE